MRCGGVEFVVVEVVEVVEVGRLCVSEERRWRKKRAKRERERDAGELFIAS